MFTALYMSISGFTALAWIVSVIFVLETVGLTLWALNSSKSWWIPAILILATTVLAAILFTPWFLLWAVLLAGITYPVFIAVKPGWKILWIVLAILIAVGGVLITGPYIKMPTSEAPAVALVATSTETAPAVYCDPSAIPYGGYPLETATKAITGPAIIEWWDQTPATYNAETGKLDLSAMRGHEGIQFLMTGDPAITPAKGIVGTVFVLNSDSDLLCVKNQHLLLFYSKPQHIYAKSPEELILPVPTAVPTK